MVSLRELDAQLREPHAQQFRTVEQWRAAFRDMMATTLVPDGTRTAWTTLGPRPALLVEPLSTSENGLILYFHGGAFIAGSPETALSLTANLVVRTGIAALSVDYRLAPEHEFPAAIEDGLGAYHTLLDRGENPASIVIAGDSAGGGLAVTTCLAARDAGLPMPGALVAFSPALDQSRTGESMFTKVGLDPIFQPEDFARSGSWYAPGQDPNQPLLSPAVLADLRGLPPMLLQVATNELLLDDATRLATRARDAGVDVILDITAGAPHVFQSYAGTLAEADAALARASLFIAQHVRE
ncbi:alpha/beta hydrolase [Dactylosporangium sp. CS-033363]|uniref:alpha/beta hydrolase n=1 Tax=Dactylosporangium sp. CS-033363 TaxID=3239935 RepID=UPI003D8C1693